jgi:hypothetical protein
MHCCCSKGSSSLLVLILMRDKCNAFKTSEALGLGYFVDILA